MPVEPTNTIFYRQIAKLLRSARQQAVRAVNQTMVVTYFEIGRLIVEKEQQGKERAEYGRRLLKELSDVLTQEFGRGFSVTNLQQIRNFYLVFQKQQTLSANSELLSETFPLSWSHYVKLMRNSHNYLL